MKRRGVFRMGQRVLERLPWPAIEAVFEGVIAVDARTNLVRQEMEFWAYSRHFDSLQDQEACPEYVAEIYETLDVNHPPQYNVVWKNLGVNPDRFADARESPAWAIQTKVSRETPDDQPA